MTYPAAAGSHTPRPRALRAASAVTFLLLGSALVITRAVGLGRSYSHDEIDTVTTFIRGGPREILAGAYRPNDHELFNLLGWLESSAVGEGETALRLLSVVPFVVGVLVVTWWLHRRVDTFTALLFAALSTFSPLLLDLSRQARGYGLAFLAMGALLVAALEADRCRATSSVAVFCCAGVVGTWTLPNFALAFLATAGVLLTNRSLRHRVVLGSALSVLAIAAWYAPHVDDLVRSSRQEFGAPISWYGVITAPVEQILAPGLLWPDGYVVTSDLSRLPLVVALALVLVASPLARAPRTGMLLGSGIALTLLAIWVTRIYLSPRFVSYLLVPLFILMASGAAHLLRAGSGVRAWLRAALALTMLGLTVVAFVSESVPILTLPREAHRDAIDVVRQDGSETPVLAYTYHPSDLEFYLGRPVQALAQADIATRVCRADTTVFYVNQPFGANLVTPPCSSRPGVRHWRFDQYARGERIDVWSVPPAG